MRRLRPILLSVLALACFAGCGDEEVRTITEVRTREKPRYEVPEDLTPAQRYGIRQRPMAGAGHGGAAGAVQRFAWKTPAGWSDEARRPGSLRKGSWTLDDAPQADCSLVVLGGSGGGLLGNVNRWRGEMGLAPIDQAAADALPRRTMLGREAVYVDLAGTYSGGMGGGGTITDARMLGLIIALPQATLFLKFTGPAEVVAANREAFESLANSITFGPQPPEVGTAPKGAGPTKAGAPGATKPEFLWAVPDGWEVQPPRMMRVVTLVPEDAPQAWCYVSRLGGTAGGLAMNINRWRGEMGVQAPLDDAGVEALPTIEVLGVEGTLLDLEGDFQGTGGPPQQGARMLGVVCPRPNEVVFIKMVGPADVIAKQRAAFLAFCTSLQEVR